MTSLYRPSIESLYSNIEVNQYENENDGKEPTRFASNSTLRTEYSIESSTTITITCCQPYEFREDFEPLSPTATHSSQSTIFSSQYDELTTELLTPTTPSQLDYEPIQETKQKRVSVNPFPLSFMPKRHTHSGALSPLLEFQEDLGAIEIPERRTSLPDITDTKPIKRKKYFFF
jgi:hypothetical protein